MIWRLEYCNKDGDVARLDIQRGAATPVETIEGTENPFLLSYELEDKNKKGFIMSSFADISIYETATFNIDDLKTLDETALSVKWYINSVLEWTGFVVPDFFSRTIGEPAIVNLAASDRLSSLEDATLDGLGEYVKIKDLAIACLAKTGLSLPLITTVDFKADNVTNIMDVFALSERLEDDKGKKISCFDVLRSILVLTNSTIRQRKGQWRIYNKIQHEAVAPTLNFNEVYQGAKRTIQPVLASVGVFQEFGGNREFPQNNSFKHNDSDWTIGGSPLFVTDFDNRDFSFATETAPAVFGQATNQNQLINRNVFNAGATSLSGTPYLKSVDIKVPLEDTGTIRTDVVGMTIEINSKSVHQSIAHFAIVRFYDGAVDSYLANDLAWKPSFTTIDINYIQESTRYTQESPRGRNQGYEVEDITTIEVRSWQGRGKDPSKYRIAVYILGVTRADSPTNRMAAIRSVKITFPESSDFGKGILYRTDQLGNFSKKSDPETTIFGDYITMGLNGYFYPYRDNDKSALKTVVGSTYSSTTEWTTATDPDAGALPILQHVTRQMSRMFGVAHNVLSAVIDAKTFDPLAIVTNCAGEKYVIVYSVFDFLRSTVEVELQQIAYGSLQRRDFIFSYFGGGDGDGISSIGSVSGGGSFGGGGGSFLDKYFSFDEANDALVANVNLVSEKEIAAYFADGSIPSIFDNIPFATSSKVGGIKAASNYQNGIRINSSGFLEIDPSYADSGVSSWDDLEGKPTSFPPSAHNHIIGDITGLQSALNGKLGAGATAYDSARLGGHLAAKYPRRDVNETIIGDWTFSGNLTAQKGTLSSLDVRGNGLFSGNVRANNFTIPAGGMFALNTTGTYTFGGKTLPWYGIGIDTTSGTFSELHLGGYGGVRMRSGAGSARLTRLGNFGINQDNPTEMLHVAGNGLFTGNVTAQKGALSSLDVSGDIKLGTALNALIKYDAVNDVIRFNKTIVSDYDVVAYADSGQDLPSIFDNLPKASTTNFGLVKIGSGISVTGGVISVDGDQFDLSNYYTKVQSDGRFKPIGYQPTWTQITGKPTSFPPSSHNHIIGDITGLQAALNGKLGTGAQAYDSARLGGHVASGYPRKAEDAVVTGAWTFTSDVKLPAGSIDIGTRNGDGLRFRNGDNFKIYFSQSSDATLGGNLAGTADFNMYFKTSGANRGWAFKYDNNVVAQIQGNGSFSAIGNLAISGTSTLTGAVTAGGNITAQGEVTAYSSSDIRLKQNIKPIENALDIISKLNPVAFNWNDKAVKLNKNKDRDRINYGVIAQELEKVLPELVHQTNDYKSVDYPQLIMVLAKGIQELKLELEELKNK